jgi:two-component system chemotaxis response regulator CheY
MGLRVLIVDDSPLMRTVVRRVMLLSGVEIDLCSEASNGLEALEWLHNHPVDLVLTDINMPQMSGADLLREMKRTGLLARIRTLVISTDSTDHRIHDMIELGAHGYVTKPFHPEALRQELDRVLGNEYAG